MILKWNLRKEPWRVRGRFIWLTARTDSWAAVNTAMNRLLLAYNLAISGIISVYQRTYPINPIIISNILWCLWSADILGSGDTSTAPLRKPTNCTICYVNKHSLYLPEHKVKAPTRRFPTLSNNPASTGLCRDRCSIPGWRKILHSIVQGPRHPWGPPSLLLTGYRRLFPPEIQQPEPQNDHTSIYPNGKNEWSLIYTHTYALKVSRGKFSFYSSKKWFVNINTKFHI